MYAGVPARTCAVACQVHFAGAWHRRHQASAGASCRRHKSRLAPVQDNVPTSWAQAHAHGASESTTIKHTRFRSAHAPAQHMPPWEHCTCPAPHGSPVCTGARNPSTQPTHVRANASTSAPAQGNRAGRTPTKQGPEQPAKLLPRAETLRALHLLTPAPVAQAVNTAGTTSREGRRGGAHLSAK